MACSLCETLWNLSVAFLESLVDSQSFQSFHPLLPHLFSPFFFCSRGPPTGPLHLLPPRVSPNISVRGQQTRRHEQGEYERERRKWRKRRGRVFSIPGTLVRIWICIDWLVIASYFCAASIVPGYLSSRQVLFKRDNEAFNAYRLLFIYQARSAFRAGPPGFSRHN